MPITYRDPMKEASRQRFERFIRTHLLTKKAARDMRVVCLPGAEVKGEEALEVKEIYDKIGIPRANIVGIEYDPIKAERLRKAKLGIEIVNGDDLSFFQTAPRGTQPFDIISLDYTGQQTREAIDSLRYIAGNQLLADDSILCTNYSANREGRNMQARYFLRTLNNRFLRGKLSKDEYSKALTSWTEGKDNPFSLDEMRDAISLELLYELLEGTFALYKLEPGLERTPMIFRTLPAFGQTMDNLRAFIEQRRTDPEFQAGESLVLEGRVYRDAEHARHQANPEYMPATLGIFMTDALGRHLARDPTLRNLYGAGKAKSFVKNKRIGLTPSLITKMAQAATAEAGIDRATANAATLEIMRRVRTQGMENALRPYFAGMFEAEIGNSLATIVSAKHNEPYAASAVERIEYTSNKGTSMLMDMIAVTRPTALWNKLDTLIRYDPITATQQANTGRHDPETFVKELINITTAWHALVQQHAAPPPREYLGSSKIVKPRLTREQALTLLSEGQRPADLADMYSGFTTMQLAALRAHLTMGTYATPGAGSDAP